MFHFEAIDGRGPFLEEVECGRIGVGIGSDEVSAFGGVSGRSCGVLALGEARVGHIFRRGALDEVGVGTSRKKSCFHDVRIGRDIIEREEMKEVVGVERVGAGEEFVIVRNAITIPIRIGVVGGIGVAIFRGVIEKFEDVVVWDAIGIRASCGKEVEG